MSDSSFRDFGRVDRFLLGAIGEPGQRTFYLFIEAGNLGAWFKCEKGQAAALGEQGLELLSTLGWEMEEEAVAATVSAAGHLPSPSTPDDVLFAVRSIAMRVESRDRLTLILEGVEGSQRAVFAITAEQLRAVAILALEAVHSGRRQCPDCLLPEDPGGHDCPSGNGHRFPG